MKPWSVTMTVNGRSYERSIEPRLTLADFLRHELRLTGTHLGCEHGVCGACTVLVNGASARACLMLAVQADGAEVRTVESLAQPDGSLHPMQQAFIDHDALQCGYCTPGQIVSAVACVNEGHAGNDAEIREFMSGNLCRCACYPNIVDAINEAKPKMRGA